MTKKRKIINIILISISALVLFYFGYRFFNKGLNNFEYDRINYTEKGPIDFRVYLKENDYFDRDYLGKDDIYITSLIDYIDVDFNYDLVFDEKQSGTYSYFVKAVISADLQNGSSSYWNKEYILTDKVTKEFKNMNVVTLKETSKVDYQVYNDLLMEFKKEYALAMDGSLKIYLCVDTDIDGKLSDGVTKSSVASLTIPLTKATIEVPIETSEIGDGGSLTSKLVYSDSKIYLFYKIVGVALFLFGAADIAYLTYLLVKKGEKRLEYYKKLKNILKTYDGIIVTVRNIPSLTDLKVIYVSEFTELLDAHSEVRMPINFCEFDDKAVFVLLNESMAWYYTLEKK